MPKQSMNETKQYNNGGGKGENLMAYGGTDFGRNQI